MVPGNLLLPMEQLPVLRCPLCDHDCETHDDLRVHLHSRHLKSSIIDSYLGIVAE